MQPALRSRARNHTGIAAAVGLAVLSLSACAAGVELASVFGPEMILQRGVAVPVWGRAAPGERVTVTFAGQRRAAAADKSGRWSVTLDAMRASARPRSLTVQGAGEPLVIRNVRVGEVWLLLVRRMGMQYSIEGPVPAANTRVRDLGGGRDNYSPTPQERHGRNQPWGPDGRQRFDALSIPFANRLSEELGVPVGIVRVRVGGLEATTPFQGFAAVPALNDIAARVETWYPTTERGRRAYAQWLERAKRWKRALDQKIERREPIEPTQPPLVPGPAPGDPAQPTVVFNRQLHPLAPFAFRGALHVHEEATIGNPRCAADPRYADKMRALIAGLRAVFRRPDLAFAFTQRNQPNIYHEHTIGGDLDFNAWAGHRDRQRRVLPHESTGMVVTLDVENHPGRVAERFARWALAEVYGKGGASSGPVYKRHRVQGACVVVEFDHTDGGLMAAEIPEVGRQPAEQKGGRLRYFAVAGENRIFHRAEARIEGDTVVVRCGKVPKPVAVRYACQFDPRGMNLYNRAGLPASPFRTDDWPLGGLEQHVERLKLSSPDELVAMLGYPAELHSHAAARALATRGEATALPIARRLANSVDPEQRCAALRTLGYLYWMGPVPRNYYSAEPQRVTPGIAKAIELIAGAAADPDPMVRRCAAEALGLIGSENETVFATIRKLGTDDDPLVRTAALRMSKYRFNAHAHNIAVAYALLTEKPFGDHTSAWLAGNLLNHYRLKGPVDLGLVSRFLQRVGPGQGGRVVDSLGDLLRRVKLPDGHPGLNRPDVLPGVLHVYALGYRRYMLYGVERWIALKSNIPLFRKKSHELKSEIERLRRDRPDGWEDLSRRYEDAIEGLSGLVEKAEQAKE